VCCIDRLSWQALYDKGVSEPLVGIEYGPSFPISQIGEIIKKQAHLAPPELIDLYHQTVKKEYECGGTPAPDDQLSACHLELAEHIFKQHERFTNRVRFVE
jgi:hypothetical protein